MNHSQQTHPVVSWLGSVEAAPKEDKHTREPIFEPENPNVVFGKADPMMLMLRDGTFKRLEMAGSTSLTSSSLTSLPRPNKHIAVSHGPSTRQSSMSSVCEDEGPAEGGVWVKDLSKVKAAPAATAKSSLVASESKPAQMPKERKKINFNKTQEQQKDAAKKTKDSKPTKTRQYGFEKKERALDQPWR